MVWLRGRYRCECLKEEKNLSNEYPFSMYETDPYALVYGTGSRIRQFSIRIQGKNYNLKKYGNPQKFKCGPTTKIKFISSVRKKRNTNYEKELKVQIKELI